MRKEVSLVNKQTSKYFHTAMRMNEALLSLLEKKDYQYITVKEICQTAGVNRSTFYLHYETVDDLLLETLEKTMERLNEKFQDAPVFNVEKIPSADRGQLFFITPEYLIPYLEFVRENRTIFMVAVTQPEALRVNAIFQKRYTDVFAPVMHRFGIDEKEWQYRLAFYLNGLFAIVTQWIKNGCEEDIAMMADLMARCVLPKRDIL